MLAFVDFVLRQTSTLSNRTITMTVTAVIADRAARTVADK